MYYYHSHPARAHRAGKTIKNIFFCASLCFIVSVETLCTRRFAPRVHSVMTAVPLGYKSLTNGTTPSAVLTLAHYSILPYVLCNETIIVFLLFTYFMLPSLRVI